MVDVTTPRPKRHRSGYVPPAEIHHCRPADVLGPLNMTEATWAPPEFWAAGDLSLLDKSHKRVAVIGSRDASEEGMRRAAKIARQLAQAGIVVVSGLAKGIDKAAHDACMAAGGKTIAVIGTPLQKAYPAEHASMQSYIAREHLLVSQFADGQRTFQSHFIDRNRFMALICHATVIVEAGEGSGTLSQAAETIRLGRPLFIMASLFDRSDLQWPKRFLNPKPGSRPAKPLTSVEQVVAEIG